MTRSGDITVIIPAYNEKDFLEGTILGIKRYIPLQDIIVVDDGSNDGTYDKANSLGVKVLHHECNLGKGVAQRTGLAHAISSGYKFAILMDADGQHSPDDLPKFISSIERNRGDLIIGRREIRFKKMQFIRVITNTVTSFITSLWAGKLVHDSQSGYRALNLEKFRGVNLTSERYDIESEMIIKCARKGFRIVEIPVRTIYGRERSYVQPVRDTVRFIKLVIRCMI